MGKLPDSFKKLLCRQAGIFITVFVIVISLTYLLSKLFPSTLPPPYWSIAIGILALCVASTSFIRFTRTWGRIEILFENTYGIFTYIEQAIEFYINVDIQRVVVHIKSWQRYGPLKKSLLGSRAKEIVFCGDIKIGKDLPGIIWRILLVDEANAMRRKQGLSDIKVFHLENGSSYPGFVLTKPSPGKGNAELLVANPSADKEFYAHRFVGYEKYSEMHNTFFDSDIRKHLKVADVQIIECLEKGKFTKYSIDRLVEELLEECKNGLTEDIKKDFKNEIVKYFNRLKNKGMMLEDNEGRIAYRANPRPPQLAGLVFSEEQKTKARTKCRLCRITLEFSRKCNLKCIYCYSNGGNKLDNELNINEIKDVINQAKQLGAETISLVGGGEPLEYPGLKEIIDYIYNADLKAVLFTNGTQLYPKEAKYLYSIGVSIIAKLNSFDRKVQSHLNGDVLGSKDLELMSQGIMNLMKAGFNSCTPTRMGVETIVCKENLREIPRIWRWLRDRNVFPYVELVKIQGRAKQNENILKITKGEAKELFEELLDIDKRWYGYDWIPSPPFPGFNCNLYYYNCYIDCTGHVQPCVGVEEHMGNIRNEPLASILAKPDFLKIRNINQHLKGKCGTCERNKSLECYGCRGHVFNTTKDPYGSDDMCWRC